MHDRWLTTYSGRIDLGIVPRSNTILRYGVLLGHGVLRSQDILSFLELALEVEVEVAQRFGRQLGQRLRRIVYIGELASLVGR